MATPNKVEFVDSWMYHTGGIGGELGELGSAFNIRHFILSKIENWEGWGRVPTNVTFGNDYFRLLSFPWWKK